MSKDTLQLQNSFFYETSLPTKEPEILKNGRKIKSLKN